MKRSSRRFSTYTTLALLAMLLVAPFSFAHRLSASPTPEPRTPNVVFIFIDDKSYIDIGAYGVDKQQNTVSFVVAIKRNSGGGYV